MTAPGSHWQARPEVARARRRTLGLLSAAQILGGIGTGAGLSVGILLAEEVTTSEGWAGLARSGTTIGAALFAIPLAALAVRAGRRTSLGAGWTVAAIGSLLMVLAAGSVGSAVATICLVVGMLLGGTGTAVTLQSRYAATDLAEPDRRSRDLSLVMWSTTVGSVLGPNLGGPGAVVSTGLGLHPFAGPFVIAAVMQLAAAALLLALRPDPLLLAVSWQNRTAGTDPDAAAARASGAPPRGVAESLRIAGRVPASRLALLAICCAHTVMVSVMTMTPIHMEHHGATVSLVGLTISLHVLGMFGLSPVVGLAADRWGRIPTMAVGGILLLMATALAGTAGDSGLRVTAGLILLGAGWSTVLVAASALLTESVPAGLRTRVQGAADAAMNACAAVGAAASGPLLGLIGFGGLNALAAGILLTTVIGVAPLVRRLGASGASNRPSPPPRSPRVADEYRSR